MADRLLFRWIALFALMLGTLAAASLCFSGSTLAATNLLKNPGFEGGTAEWSLNYSTAVFQVVTTTVHAGSYAASLTSNSSSIKYIWQTIPNIVPGTRYSFSGYGYIADTNVDKIYLRLAWYGTPDCSGSQIATVDSNAITTLGSYQPLTATAKTAPSNAACARLRASLDPISSTTTTAYFDDLTFSVDEIPPTPVPPAEKLLITEVLYDGTLVNEGDEFVELTNPLTKTVDLSGYKVGDEETKGANEGMYVFPAGTNLVPNAVLVVAKNAEQFHARFGFDPAFELVTSGSGLTDTPSVPNLAKYTAWAGGSLALSNTGDEVLLLGPSDELVDTVAWGNGDFATVGLAGNASAPAPLSLQRYGNLDTNNMTFDFLSNGPAPGTLVAPPKLTTPTPGAAMPGGMRAYWGDLHAHSTASDGSGPPRMAYATARSAGLHFFALTDHDSWLTQAEWDEIGNAAGAATVDNAFVALRAFEFTSPDGHVTAFNTSSWVSHTDPKFDSLSKIYSWLGAQPNAFVQFNHPVWDRGGDFNNMAFNAAGAGLMTLQEIGNNAHMDYDNFESMYITALNRDWQVAPTNNSDNHDLTWGSDSPHRVGVIAPALTQAGVIDALRARRVFATEDSNLAVGLQANGVWMGSTIRAEQTINFTVTVSDPDDEAWWLDFYDNGKVVLSQSYTNATTWTGQVKGNSSHYYFVRVTQIDGDRAYSAPIWTDDTPTTQPAKRWDLGRVTVAKARVALLDALVELDACVTAPPGVFGDRYMYIQDPTAGIKIYLRSENGDFPQLRLNDRVVLRGRTRLIEEEGQVEIEDTKTIDVRGICEPVAPIKRTTGRINAYSEGLLVEIAGVVKGIGQGEFVLSDNNGDAQVYINPTTRVRLPQLAVGQSVRVIGLVGRAHGAIAVLPRYGADIVLASVATLPRATSTRTPTSTQRAMPTRTPTVTLHAALPIATSTREQITPTTTPRAFMRPTPAPVPAASPINGRALAAVGGSTLVGAGFLMFAMAAAMLRRRH